MAGNLNLKQTLNDLWLRPRPPPTGRTARGKSGQQQIVDNGDQILLAAEYEENWVAERHGLGPCMISTASVDGRGRPVKSMRVRTTNWGQEVKREFRAYHVAWVSTFGQIPQVELQYSHRCHNGQCVQPLHGTWEDDLVNKSRNACKNSSHISLPNGAILALCRHSPICLSGLEILDWNDPRVIQQPRNPTPPPPSPSNPSASTPSTSSDEEFAADWVDDVAAQLLNDGSDDGFGDPDFETLVAEGLV